MAEGANVSDVLAEEASDASERGDCELELQR
jgi:hypothetical protein